MSANTENSHLVAKTGIVQSHTHIHGCVLTNNTFVYTSAYDCACSGQPVHIHEVAPLKTRPGYAQAKKQKTSAWYKHFTRVCWSHQLSRGARPLCLCEPCASVACTTLVLDAPYAVRFKPGALPIFRGLFPWWRRFAAGVCRGGRSCSLASCSERTNRCHSPTPTRLLQDRTRKGHWKVPPSTRTHAQARTYARTHTHTHTQTHIWHLKHVNHSDIWRALRILWSAVKMRKSI